MNRRGFFGRMFAGAAAVAAAPAVQAFAQAMPSPEPETPAAIAPTRGYLPSYIGLASDEQFYDSDDNCPPPMKKMHP